MMFIFLSETVKPSSVEETENLPESLDMEAEHSWQASDAKLFGARLLRLALLAVKPRTNRINLRKYSRGIKSLHLSVSSNSSFSINF